MSLHRITLRISDALGNKYQNLLTGCVSHTVLMQHHTAPVCVTPRACYGHAECQELKKIHLL